MALSLINGFFWGFLLISASKNHRATNNRRSVKACTGTLHRRTVVRLQSKRIYGSFSFTGSSFDELKDVKRNACLWTTEVIVGVCVCVCKTC